MSHSSQNEAFTIENVEYKVRLLMELKPTLLHFISTNIYFYPLELNAMFPSKYNISYLLF